MKLKQKSLAKRSNSCLLAGAEQSRLSEALAPGLGHQRVKLDVGQRGPDLLRVQDARGHRAVHGTGRN